MKIWLDDERPVPDDTWTHVQTGKDFKFYVDCFQHNITHISFDHDLGLNEPTGYDLSTWLEEKVFNEQIEFVHNVCFRVHSANPVGKQRIIQSINKIENMIYLGLTRNSQCV